MSLIDVLAKYDVHNRKLTVESASTRYLCFTRIASNGAWVVCVTDAVTVWRLEFDYKDLVAYCDLSGQPNVESFLSYFSKTFNSSNVTLTKVADHITMVLTNGITFDLSEAVSADCRSEIKYVLFNMADDLKIYDAKLSAANETITTLKSQVVAGGSKNPLLELGPKTRALSARVKPVKEDGVNGGTHTESEYMIQSIVYDDMDTSAIQDFGNDIESTSPDLTTVYDIDDAAAMTWHRKDVLKLIQVYGQLRHRFLVHGVKKKHVWEMIAVKMGRLGVKVSVQQCENKWKNLMRTHKQSQSSDEGNRCWFSNEIIQVLNSRPDEAAEDAAEHKDIEQEVAKKILQSNKSLNSYNWPRDAVLLLIKTYAVHKQHFLRPGMLKKHVWNLIAADIEKRGHIVTASQCAAKWTNLTRQYKNAIEAGQTIDREVKPGPFFDEVHKLYTDIAELEQSNHSTDGADDDDRAVSNENSVISKSDNTNKNIYESQVIEVVDIELQDLELYGTPGGASGVRPGGTPDDTPVTSNDTPDDTSDVTPETSSIIQFLGEMNKQERKDQQTLLDKLNEQHQEKIAQEERKMKLFESLLERLPVNK